MGLDRECFRQGARSENLHPVASLEETRGFERLGGHRCLGFKMFVKIADMLSEDALKNLGISPASGSEDDEKKFQEWSVAVATNDQKHPLMNDKDPQHQGAVAEWTRLNNVHSSRKQ